MDSVEFIYLKNLIKNGKARISISQFFVLESLHLWLKYKNNQILNWANVLFNIFTSEWLCIPFSIFLAWRLHIWWLIIVGIAFCWIIDEIAKFLIYYFMPDSILRDEKLLNYFWNQNLGYPTISIQSTKKAKYDYYPKGEMPVIMIIPPEPWRSVVNEFKEEEGLEHSDSDKNYIEFKERFKNMSDEQLIETYNKDKNNPGWTNSRAMFQGALHEEIESRKLNTNSTK